MTRCVVLIDGEHYPPVVAATLDHLAGRGYEVVGAVFLGGTEKTERAPDLGVEVVTGGAAELAALLERLRPTEVVDLSDEPVLDPRRRLALAGAALRAGVAYAGGGFRFEPPPRPRLTALPTVSVSATGKRTGKTALAIELARHWKKAGRRVAIVTMGRGGPPEPVVLRAGSFDRSAAGLRGLAAAGLHAASDYAEDAFFAEVDTVGTFRCGAGLSGEAVHHNFHLGVSTAEGLAPDLMIYEGSGAALPPAAADAAVLVVPATLDAEYLAGYFGPFRLALADAVVITGDAPGRARLAELAGAAGRPSFHARYEPEPTVEVAGRSVLAITTAPEAGGLEGELAQQGATKVEVLPWLSDRPSLAAALAAAATPDLLLVEIKAAAVDMVLPWSEERSIEVGFIHNRLLLEGGMGELTALVEHRWASGR